jgi:hypothetical protein
MKELTAWTSGAIGEAAFGDLLRGLHNKFGLLLIIFFVIHISVYTK